MVAAKQRALAAMQQGARPRIVQADSDFVGMLIGDPAFFAWTWFGRQMLSHQRDIAYSVRDNHKTAVRAGHGIGKSFTAAVIAIWFLWSNMRSKVITTAPTWRQVEKILWSEFNSLVSVANTRVLKLPSGMVIAGLGPEPLNTQWQLDKNWFAEGISTKKKESFQGSHADRVLAILDEASGVPDEIFKATEDITTGEHDRILAIGNPTQNAGEFYGVFNNSRAGLGWSKIHLDCEQMPWIVSGEPPPFPGLVSQRWIDEKRQKYGDDHPLYHIHVKGNFAATADDLLMSLYDAERATETEVKPRNMPSCLAVDVADFGNNKTVFSWWRGDELTKIKKYSHRDPMEVAGLIVKEWEADRTDALVIDADGIGRGVSTRCMELGLPVTEFRGGEAATEPDEYFNLRSEAAFVLTKQLKRLEAKIPVDDELILQLSYLPYKIRSDGRLMLIPKEELKSRGHESPDCVDSAMMGRWGQVNAMIDRTPYVPSRSEMRGGETIKGWQGTL